MLGINVVTVVILTMGISKCIPNPIQKSIIGKESFIDQFVVYKSEHDIISVAVPTNRINFGEDTDELPQWIDSTNLTAYFVEADIDEHGHTEYKGLYSLKNRVVTKVLESGTDAYAANDTTSNVYFAAKDGIYIFNANINVTEKYGTVTDSLISLVKLKHSDTLYVLTEGHEVYKVTDGGCTKEKLDNLKDVQQIVLDNSDKLYFYGKDKAPYYVTEDGVTKVDGIPENPTYVHLIRPANILNVGVLFLVDKNIYILDENNSTMIHEFEVTLKPTAYSIETTAVSYFAYNKKIYQFELLALAFSSKFDDLATYLQGKIDYRESLHN